MASGKRLKNGEELASEKGLKNTAKVVKQVELVNEATWQQQVNEIAERNGWLVRHTGDSRRSDGGVLDLLLIRPPRIIFAELKKEKGRLTHTALVKGRHGYYERFGQTEMFALLTGCPGVESYIWRPSQRDELEALLRDTRCVDCGHEEKHHINMEMEGLKKLVVCYESCPCKGYRPRMAPQ